MKIKESEDKGVEVKTGIAIIAALNNMGWYTRQVHTRFTGHGTLLVLR